MSFNNFNSSVKLNNIKTYNKVNTKNDAFKNTFYSDIEEIDYSKYEEVDYNSIDLEEGIEKAQETANEQPWYKTLYDYSQTIRASFTWGVLEVVENVGDGLIMAGGSIASGVVGIWDEELADEIKQDTQEVIQYDWTEAGYQAEMEALGVSEEISQGLAHTIAGGAGTMAGYVAMSLIPGGAAVTATAGALSAVGSSAQTAFNSGATYEEALAVSAVSAVAGAASGGALNKIGAAAKGAQSLAQVGGYALAGAAVSMSEPVINSTAEYLTYGKDMVDENGNKTYENFGEYYVNSGGLLNTVIAGGIGFGSTGVQGISGYITNKKSYGSSPEINKDYLTGRKIIEADYDTNLERKIFDRMPENLTELEQSKYIYNKLNEEMAYSSEYFFATDKNIKTEIFEKTIDLSNVTDNKIVCSNWSEMYCELLKQNGMNAKVMGAGHKWVVFELSDGTKWLADATQPYNGFTDLTNAKTGTKTGGFFQISDEMYYSNDVVLGRENTSKASILSQKSFDVVSAVDRNLGYDYSSVDDLFGSALSSANDILDASPNSTFGELAAIKLESIIFPQVEELELMEGLGYFSKMKGILDPAERKLISYTPVTKSDGGHYIVFSVDLQNGTTAEYIYDSVGKITKDLIQNLR